MSEDARASGDHVVVPDVLGLIVDDARRIAGAANVTLAPPDPDGPPVSALTWRLPVVVTSQDPAPGTRLRRHHSVTITWSDEPAGDREPRHPLPLSRLDSEAQARPRDLT